VEIEVPVFSGITDVISFTSRPFYPRERPVPFAWENGFPVLEKPLPNIASSRSSNPEPSHYTEVSRGFPKNVWRFHEAIKRSTSSLHSSLWRSSEYVHLLIEGTVCLRTTGILYLTRRIPKT
jgi:hypothetical protein